MLKFQRRTDAPSKILWILMGFGVLKLGFTASGAGGNFSTTSPQIHTVKKKRLAMFGTMCDAVQDTIFVSKVRIDRASGL